MRALFAASLVSRLGTWMATLVIGFLAFDETGSAFWAAAVAAAYAALAGRAGRGERRPVGIRVRGMAGAHPRHRSAGRAHGRGGDELHADEHQPS
jgi:hypothetical protein